MTKEEILALLNQSTDNILSDANRLNLTANKMSNTVGNILPNYGIMGTDQANIFAEDEDLDEIGLTPSGKEVGYVGYDPAESMDISIGRKTPQLGDLTSFIDPFATMTARERELDNIFKPKQNFQFQTSAYEDDEEGDIEALREKPSGIARLFELYQKFSPINFLGQLLPKQDPRAINMRNFYGNQYGLTSSGSLASGIMAGYNPISGGLFGTPVNYGLADAARRRIEKIANRKAAQTDASRAKIAELQRFAEADTISRARQAAPDVYRDAGDRLGPGGGFSTSGREGAFSSKSGRGRQDF